MATFVFRQYGGNGVMRARVGANGTYSNTKVFYPGQAGFNKSLRMSQRAGASTGISVSDDKSDN